MTRRPAALPTGLLAALAAVPAAAAALPGENVWRPLGETFVMIWPTYAGNVGHLIDAILMFMLVTMTVVDVSKRTSVPKKAAWAVGIGLWIALMVPLITSGRLVFQSAWFAFIGFLIVTIILGSLLKGVFERIFDKRANGAQWTVALCIAILGVGSVFASLLRSVGVRSSSEQFIVSLMYAAIALAAPLLIIMAVYLGVRAYKNTSAGATNNSDSKNLHKMQNKADKQLKKQRKEEQKIQHDKQHNEYLSELEEKQEQLERDMKEYDEREEVDLDRILQDAQQVLATTSQVQPTLEQYAQWIRANRGKAAQARNKVQSTVGEGENVRTDLPKEYHDRLDSVAQGLEQKLAQLAKEVDDLEHAVLEEQRAAQQNHIQQLEKHEQSLAQEENQLWDAAHEAAEKLDRIKQASLRIEKRLAGETKSPGPLRQVLRQNNAYNRLVQTLIRNLKQTLAKKEEAQTYAQQLKNGLDTLDEYFAYTKKVLDWQQEDLQKGAQALKEFPAHAKKAKNEIVPAVRTIDVERLAKGASEVNTIKKEAAVERERVHKRAEQETNVAEYLKKIQDVQQQNQEAYAQLYRLIEDELRSAIILAALAETTADFDVAVARLEAGLVKELQAAHEHKDAHEIHQKLEQEVTQEVQKLRDEFARLLRPLQRLEQQDQETAKLLSGIQQTFITPLQQLSKQLPQAVHELGEQYEVEQ